VKAAAIVKNAHHVFFAAGEAAFLERLWQEVGEPDEQSAFILLWRHATHYLRPNSKPDRKSIRPLLTYGQYARFPALRLADRDLSPLWLVIVYLKRKDFPDTAGGIQQSQDEGVIAVLVEHPFGRLVFGVWVLLHVPVVVDASQEKVHLLIGRHVLGWPGRAAHLIIPQRTAVYEVVPDAPLEKDFGAHGVMVERGLRLSSTASFHKVAV
jgi:hypothetical protein